MKPDKWAIKEKELDGTDDRTDHDRLAQLRECWGWHKKAMKKRDDEREKIKQLIGIILEKKLVKVNAKNEDLELYEFNDYLTELRDEINEVFNAKDD